MEKQNVTLSLPRDLIKRVKVLAAEQDSSISAILERLLSEYANHQDGYRQARQDHASLLKNSFELGTGGSSSWGLRIFSYSEL